MNTKTVADKLHRHGLRVTPQRMWVLDYLDTHRVHPDSEQVFQGLLNEDRRLTRATVYNALQALVEHGLAVEVKIEGDRMRYDANIDLHGHFVCRCCGGIYDFDVKQLKVSGLDGFNTQAKDVYYSGECKNCLNLK